MTWRITGFFLLLACGVISSASAWEYRFDELTLNLPESIQGPLSISPAPGVETTVFPGQGWPETPANVLQLIRHELGVKPADAAGAASRHLLDLLGAVERHRSAYSQTPVETVRLGSVSGVRAKWKGTLKGIVMNGAMYCALVGTRVLCFHAFGPGETPDEELKQLIGAVEGTRGHDS
jgi:hypothetical protein